MKKTILLVLVLAGACYSQEVVIHHAFYTTVFSESLRIPVVVKWWVTRRMVECPGHVRRTNRFEPDPDLRRYTNLGRDYRRSGYDRGHNMPAGDNACNPTGMKESFYYSNMCPQTASLNRGAWKKLETHCRALAEEYDSVLVWCGSVSTSHKTIGPDRVAVPDYCWKIVFVKKTGRVYAYSFRDDRFEDRPLASYEVTVDSVEHLSGIKFVHTN